MDKNSYFRTPSQLFRELGIASADEIDVEAIAYHCNATIRYRPLTGCAARIVGNGNTAIITVNSESPRPRQRFSAAHELGHWMRDRGKASFSCRDVEFITQWSRHNPESRANMYASDLVLPVSLFTPAASAFKAINFDAVRNLADTFVTSLTATAIRLVEYGPLPAMLVCYSLAGREWFVRAAGVPKEIWPHEKIVSGSYAFDLLKSSAERELKGEVSAAAWFNHSVANRYDVYEHSLRTRYGEVFTLLWWKNEQMLIDIEEYEERRAARRSDRRRDE
ncbi:MAG: ImmA/IrrE family metallo-endopeptidase [Candidatus Binatus sp.]|uniref:ImmA/IrrE family metallo-endopeptidase n=1 Tax=Candidatus Binatus sp. TaxID=2811406 RepID=UPI003C72649E